MNGFGILLILGIAMYYLLSKNNPMGCCSGHAHREPPAQRPDREKFRETPPATEAGMIIDLKPEEFEIISEEPIRKIPPRSEP